MTPQSQTVSEVSISKQPDKGEQTRIRLMQATLDAIANHGWAGTSTARISELAGVSRGAQTHHFPTKTSLLLAALEHMTQTYTAQVKQQLGLLADEERTLIALLGILWQGFLNDGFNQSAIEALVAGRTEPALRDAIAALDTKTIDSFRQLAGQLTDQGIEAAALEDLIEMSVYYFRGLVVQRGIHEDSKYRYAMFDMWCNTIEAMISANSNHTSETSGRSES